MKIFLLGCFLLSLPAFSLTFGRQIKVLVDDDRTEKYIIGYLDTFSYHLDEQITWSISNASSKTIFEGKGPIANIIFSEPGEYTIHLKESMSTNHQGCGHNHAPETIILTVSPLSLKFDFETIRFSQPLQAGSLDGVNVTVECYFKNYDNSSKINWDVLKVIGAGIGAEFTGKLINVSPINKDKYLITFSLKGSIASNTFIMFDFIDLNNQIQTYYHTTQIK